MEEIGGGKSDRHDNAAPRLDPISGGGKHDGGLTRDDAPRLEPVSGGFKIEGDLTRDGVKGLWPIPKDVEAVGGKVTLDASGVGACDSAGLAWLVLLNAAAAEKGARLEVVGLEPGAMSLYEGMVAGRTEPGDRDPGCTPLSMLGRRAVAAWRRTLETLSFTGEVTLDICRVAMRPRSVRWGDFVRAVVETGVHAIPVVMLVSFLLGLILAFQSSIPLKLFGAEIYVASILGVSIVRELGGIVAAIMMAGRTASAFAAEIGTMVVNEEVDALRTMGLSPVRFLAVPRVLAAALALPVLSLFANIAGIFGGYVVLRIMGYSFQAFHKYTMLFVDAGDFYGSVFKTVVFGVLVASIGCLRGLQTGDGADAVGRSATSAVVTSIVAVAVADGVFAVVFYVLGI
ncbi:MAG: ABC transporter permease [Kiritimatiellia bacterium]|jgi:phospholipid/cholesterol/gamma-HCH transport system permease protein